MVTSVQAAKANVDSPSKISADQSNMINLLGGAAIGVVAMVAAPLVSSRLGWTMPGLVSTGIGLAGGYAGYQLLSHTVGKNGRAGENAKPMAGQQQIIDAARDVMKQSPTATKVLQGLDEHDIPIVIMKNEDFDGLAPGAGAFFDPKSGKIIAPESQMDDPVWAALLLTHEGTHAMDYTADHGSLFMFPKLGWGMIAGGVSAALHLDNPVSGMVDGVWRQKIDSEANAYLAQGKAAQELGLSTDYGMFSSDGKGGLRTKEATLDAVLEEDLYAMDGGRRMIFSTGMAVMAYVAADLALGAGLTRLGVPRAGAIATATAAVGAGALLLHDIKHHPDRG